MDKRIDVYEQQSLRMKRDAWAVALIYGYVLGLVPGLVVWAVGLPWPVFYVIFGAAIAGFFVQRANKAHHVRVLDARRVLARSDAMETSA